MEHKIENNETGAYETLYICSSNCDENNDSFLAVNKWRLFLHEIYYLMCDTILRIVPT